MLGKVFPECLYDRIGEGQFVVYAVVGNRLLKRLWDDDAGAVVFTFFVFRCHVLRQEIVWPLFTYGCYLCLCGDGSMSLCERACKCLVERDA